MRLSKSWTRREYETAYSWMRRGIDCEYLLSTGNLAPEAIKAADYSYQARDHEVHAWSNNMRRQWFHKTKWRILTEREVHPY
jgi:hypothetical protein